MINSEKNYVGTLRLMRGTTIQSWIDKGWYKELTDQGFIFAIGCARFRKKVCDCTHCRNASTDNKAQLRKKVLELNNLLN